MKFLTVNEAVELLKQGEVVAIPTETVYGLAADARNDEAVAKIFTAKGRPADNPLIVHIGDIAQVDGLVTAVTPAARILMEHFWPGPLTIILPSAGTVSKLVSAGLSTVGIRMPAHPLTLSLLRDSGIPLAAPSANLSGKPSPTKASHVAADLVGKVQGILDGGTCDIGLESTVIDMTTEVPTILRPGGVSRTAIESALGRPVQIATGIIDQPKAPGMKYTHYAPDAEVYIVDGSNEYFTKTITEFHKKGMRIGILCSEPASMEIPGITVAKGLEKGKNLYAALREFDEENIDVILCEYQNDEAIMNRLLKASEERVLREVEN